MADNEIKLTPAQVGLLIDALLQTAVFRDASRLNAFISKLPFWDGVAYDAVARSHAVNLIDSCADHPFGFASLADALWLFEPHSNATDKFLGTLDKIVYSAISWKKMAELQPLLALSGIAPKRAREAFALLPHFEDHVQSKWEPEWYLRNALYHFAALRFEPDLLLLKFLYLCLPEMPKSIEDWIASIAFTHSVDLDVLKVQVDTMRQAETDRPRGEPVLLVRIKPLAGGVNESGPVYKIDGWLFQGAEASQRSHLELPREITDTEFGDRQAADMIHKVAQFALGQLPDPPRFLSVEAILPAQLLVQDIDGWDVQAEGIPPEPLGAKYQLTVRSYERIYNPVHWTNRGLWKDKWLQCMPLTQDLKENHLYWARSAADYRIELAHVLKERCIMLVGIQPQAEPRVSCGALLGAALASGTPLALLLRKRAEDWVTVEAELGSAISGQPIGSLPVRLYEMRNRRLRSRFQPVTPGETPHACWDHITLLWDPFGRFPADRDP